MQITITIESTYGGSAAGYQVQSVHTSDNVGSIVAAFCEAKNISYNTSFSLKGKDGLPLDNNKTVEESGIQHGDLLYLTSCVDEEQTFGFSNWWILSGIAFTIAVIGLVAVSIIFSLNGSVPFDYSVVFDAGSTHTQMVLYSWEGDKWQGTGVVQQKTSCSDSVGISSFATHPADVTKSLTPCLESAKNAVPSSRYATTPIFLGATAGMRVLNISNVHAADDILSEVRKLFSSSGFQYSEDNVCIISGEQEGTSGWVTVNYLQGNFGQLPEKSSSLNTAGALDLGGASTQITFEVPSNSTGVNTNSLILYGHPYKIYSRSYLCYGVVELRKRYYAQLYKNSDGTSVKLDSPCDPAGNITVFTNNTLFESPCTWNKDEVSMEQLEQNVTIEFSGSSNSSLCTKEIQLLLNTSFCQDNFNECFENSSMPNYDGNIVAFSAFYYLALDLNVTANTTEKEFLTSAEHVCNMTWSELKHLSEQGIPEDELLSLCFESLYMYLLLVEGYGYSDPKWSKIEFKNKINEADVGWTLGYMINKTNVIPAELPVDYLPLASFIALVILFVVFFVTAGLFAFHARRLQKSSSKYQRLSYGTMES